MGSLPFFCSLLNTGPQFQKRSYEGHVGSKNYGTNTHNLYHVLDTEHHKTGESGRVNAITFNEIFFTQINSITESALAQNNIEVLSYNQKYEISFSTIMFTMQQYLASSSSNTK